MRRPTTTGRHTLGLAATALLICAGLGVAEASGRDWLDVRRQGIVGMLRAANESEGAQPRLLRYRSEAGKGHPLAGATLELRRRPIQDRSKATAAGRPKMPGGTDLVIELTGSDGKRIAALAREGDTLWTQHGKAAPSSDDRGVFVRVPGLGVPLALFATLELAPRYEGSLEGEFEGTAILRMKPGYTKGPHLEPLKIGLSKQTLQLTVTEVDDAKGEMQARLLMLELKHVEDRVVAHRLRLRAKDSKDAIEFRLVEELVGEQAAKSPAFKRWGRKALRGQ